LHDAFEDLVALASLGNFVPSAEHVRLFLGERKEAVLVLDALEEHEDFVADLDVVVSLRTLEFADVDLAFGLVSDVDEDLVLADRDDASQDDFTFGDGIGDDAVLEELGEGQAFFLVGILLVVVIAEDFGEPFVELLRVDRGARGS
jgi:hypothetical protein